MVGHLDTRESMNFYSISEVNSYIALIYNPEVTEIAINHLAWKVFVEQDNQGDFAMVPDKIQLL